MNPDWGGHGGLAMERVRARIKVRVERGHNGPWRRCITAPPAKEKQVTNQVIPEEAVEATARAIHEAGDWNSDTPWTGDDWRADCARTEARAALEAAAPHMLAGAWEEGYMFSYDQERGGNGELPIPVPEYLRDDLAHWNPHRTPDAR